jgi:hypothetical protein
MDNMKITTPYRVVVVVVNVRAANNSEADDVRV